MQKSVDLKVTCILCRKEYVVTVDLKDFYEWKKGKLTQDAFPYLSADDREVLISNICGSCFDKQFKEEE